MSEYDILIANSKIVDGVNKAYTGSIGVKGGAVAAVGEVTGDAARVIDASGLLVVPGFVDPHSHADGSFPWYPDCESAVMRARLCFSTGQPSIGAFWALSASEGVRLSRLYYTSHFL